MYKRSKIENLLNKNSWLKTLYLVVTFVGKVVKTLVLVHRHPNYSMLLKNTTMCYKGRVDFHLIPTEHWGNFSNLKVKLIFALIDTIEYRIDTIATDH